MGNKASVLVCVTGQRDCDRLIKEGKRLAQERSLMLHVLCVQPSSAGYDTDGEELEYLRQTARDASAEMTVYFNDEAAIIAAGFSKRISAKHIVTGMAGDSNAGIPSNRFIEIIHSLVPHVPISMVAKDGKVYHICPTTTQAASAEMAITV